MSKNSPEYKIEIGSLSSSEEHIYDISLPLSLDSVNYPKLRLINIKAWYLFISIVREATPEEYQAGICSYTIPSLEFAKMMNMNQPRGKRAVDALKFLANIPIQISEGDGINIDEQDLTYVHLIMRLHYAGKEKGKPLTVWVDPIVNDLIFHSRQIINFDYQDIAKLTSIASIHVFTILWRLHLQHIHTINLQDFKKMLRVEDKYRTFKDFSRTYINPVETDIRQNTPYKNFHFSYTWTSQSGKITGVQVIHFNFDSPKQIKEQQELDLNLSSKLLPEFQKKIAHCNSVTQELLGALYDEGYAVNTYMNLILKVIAECSEAAFRKCALSIMLDAQKKKQSLKYKYGKILTKELKALLSKQPSKQELIRDNMQKQSFADQQAWQKAYKERAKASIRFMTIEERQRLLTQYEGQISQYLKNGQRLNRLDILATKFDARRASCKAFIAFLAEAYRTGFIELKPMNF